MTGVREAFTEEEPEVPGRTPVCPTRDQIAHAYRREGTPVSLGASGNVSTPIHAGRGSPGASAEGNRRSTSSDGSPSTGGSRGASYDPDGGRCPDFTSAEFLF